MAKTYRIHAGTRVINRLFRILTRLGLGAHYRHILGVRGRKTGKSYDIPVDVMELGGQRYLVAGYGLSNWVRNLRASGEATLVRGRRSERIKAVELPVAETPPVLRKYVTDVPATRPYFDTMPASSDAKFITEARRHPVFRITPTP